MKIGTTYPAFNYDIERSFKNALGTATEVVLIKTYEDLESVNLLAFPGGEDVSPSLYNQNNIHSYGLNANRDKREEFLYKHAAKLEIPMFGMCRGLQFLAVMLGQSLIQDIYSELEQIHKGSHPIDVVLPSIISKNFQTVNSLHHQGVYVEDDVRQTLRNLKYHGIYVTSYHNGIVESFESKGIIATQFHPEFMFSKESDKFFTDLGEWVEKKGFTFEEKEYDAVLFPEKKQKEGQTWYGGSSVSGFSSTPDWAVPPEYATRGRVVREVSPSEDSAFAEYVRRQARTIRTDEVETSSTVAEEPRVVMETPVETDYWTTIAATTSTDNEDTEEDEENYD